MVIPGGDDSRNVRIGSETIPIDEDPVEVQDEIEPRVATKNEIAPATDPPRPSAADRPSLQKALLSYALPVVCTWFGSIVVDLFWKFWFNYFGRQQMALLLIICQRFIYIYYDFYIQSHYIDHKNSRYIKQFHQTAFFSFDLLKYYFFIFYDTNDICWRLNVI